MPNDIRQVIENSHLFAGLGQKLIDEIAASVTRRTLEANEILFQKGHPADALWGVLSGRILIDVSSDDGKEMVLGTIVEGEVFGEVGVLDFGPRRVEARAVEKSELFRLERKHFLSHLQSSPELCFRVFSLLCSHLRDATENLEDTALYKLPNRLAKRLTTLVGGPDGNGTDLTNIVHIGQSDLAGVLGVNREAVNRHLRVFEKDGLISLSRQQIEILDHETLSSIAAPAQFRNDQIWGHENIVAPQHRAFISTDSQDASTQPEARAVGLLAVDAAEYSSALMTDAARTMKLVKDGLEGVDLAIAQNQGHSVWHTGDRVLAEFPDAKLAMQAALDIQEQTSPAKREGPGQSLFRIGVHEGEVLAGSNQFTGQAVTTAIQLTRLSSAGGIAISGAVRDTLDNPEQLSLQFLGEHELKNIQGRVQVYSAHAVPLPRLLVIRARTLVPRRLRQAVAIVTAVALAAVIWFWGGWMGRKSVPVIVLPLSIAVLPFSNNAGPELDYVAAGIPQDIRSSLSRIPGMRVIGQESSDYYKSRITSPEEIGRTLEVAWLLHGNLEKLEDQNRITAQLTNTGSGEVMWEHQFDDAQAGFASFGSDIVRGVATALGLVDDSGAGISLSPPMTTNSEAYAHFQKAQQLWNIGEIDNFIEAISLFRKAIELDPSFAEAHAMIGKYVASMPLLDQQEEYSPAIRKELANRSRKKAISLKPNSPWVLAATSFQHRNLGEIEGALSLAEKALSLDPNNTEALWSLYYIRLTQRDWLGILQLSERLVAVEPLSTAVLHAAWHAQMKAGHYGEALAITNRVFTYYEENAVPSWHGITAETKLQMGDRVGAVISYRKGLTVAHPIDLWTGLDYDQGVLDKYLRWWSHGTLVYLEKYDQVREILKHRYDDAESNAEWLSSPQYLGMRGDLEALAGNFKSALEHYERARLLVPDLEVASFGGAPGIYPLATGERQSLYTTALLLTYRKTNHLEDAEKIAAKIEDWLNRERAALSTVSDQAEYKFLYEEAQFHAIEGRNSQAIDTLRAWVEHGIIFTYISWDPFFDSLRGNSEFEAIVAQVEAELAEVRAQYHAQQVALQYAGS